VTEALTTDGGLSTLLVPPSSSSGPTTSAVVQPSNDAEHVVHEENDESEQPAASATFPVCCKNSTQFEKWKKTDDWLRCDFSRQLFCSVCRQMSAPSPFAQGTVKQATSAQKLLKKIYKHEASAEHLTCVEDLKKRDKKAIQKAGQSAKSVYAKQNEQKINITCRIFRTVYEIVQSCLSFSEHANLVCLQELNGLSMGSMLTSHNAAAEVAKHIANEMQSELVAYILKHGSKFSVLVDESTDVSQQQSLIVYIRLTFDAKPCNYFFDLIPIATTTAEALEQYLLTSLEHAGLTVDIMKKQMIGFCSDGASNMTGKLKGLATLLRAKVGDHLQTFHCMAHRLELAVHNTVSSVTEASHFQMLVDTLYAMYSRSPKNQRELELHAQETSVHLLKVGRVFDVKWIFSSFRATKALWRDHPALSKHLLACIQEMTRTGAERSKCNGLLKKLTNWYFVAELAMIKDALRSLQELSLFLQRENASAVDAF